MKPRRTCTVCGKWTTVIYMHMAYAHGWNDQQINELKVAIRNEKLIDRKTTIVFECQRCGLGLGGPSSKPVKEKQFEYSIDGSKEAPKNLPIRPPIMPPLPEQLSESEKGSEHVRTLPYDSIVSRLKRNIRSGYISVVRKRVPAFRRRHQCGQVMRCIGAIELGHSGLQERIRSGCTSKKAQTHCSAFLRTSEYTDGSVDVTCCFGHIFHELDPTALRLNERQCGVLRKALEEKKCITEICAQMKAEYPPTNRLHYTTSNDIR
ncbi:hypothetical protein COOONC_11623 [Cooperia oncophora]